MAASTIHPDHVEGLRYLLDWEFETGCDERDRRLLRELMAFGDQLGWKEGDPVASEVQLPDAFLYRFAKLAWELGHDAMVTYHAAAEEGSLDAASERRGRSLLAFAEQHRSPAGVA